MRTVHCSGWRRGGGRVGVSQHALGRGGISQNALGRGVSAQEGGVHPSMHWAGGGVCVCIPACTGQVWCLPGVGGPATPPPVNRITDACENITLPQLRCGR